MAKHRRKHRRNHSLKGFTKDHPWMTYFLASSAIFWVGNIVYTTVTGKSIFNGYRPYNVDGYRPYRLDGRNSILVKDYAP